MKQHNLAAHLRKSIFLYSALSIAIVGVVISLVSLIPFYRTLKHDVERSLVLALNNRTLAVEEHLAYARNVAAQVTSRTRIREELEKYNQGDIDLQELIDFSAPKLAEALKISPEVAGMVRFDQAGNPVIVLDMPIPEAQWAAWPIRHDQIIVYNPIEFNGTSYLLVSAPIYNLADEQVGTDVLAFDSARLQAIVEESPGLGADNQALLGTIENEQFQPFFSDTPDMSTLGTGAGTTVSTMPQDFVAPELTGVIVPNDGTPELTAYQTVNGSDWVLAITVNTQELYAPVHRQVGLLAGVLAALLVLGIWGMTFLLRPLTGKIVLHTNELAREIHDKTASLKSEITERKALEERLQHHVLHDELTGLPNRILFLELLEHAMRRALRQGPETLAILSLDVDNFKTVNDSLGHMQGDQLLITIARRLKHYVRTSDTVARFGSDEFVILLEDLGSPEDASLLAARIQDSLMQPLDLNGHNITISISIGIAIGSADYEHCADILRDADTALHTAKAMETGQHMVFQSTMRDHALSRLQTEAALRHAIEQQQLCLHYQPIVSLEQGHIIGFEALVRWEHPERGMISPAEFIPIAEQTGLIVPIGEWVLWEACRQLQSWQRQFPEFGPLVVNVNLSGKEVMRSGIVEKISQVLASTGLNPACLKLEITESIMVDHAETTVTTLNRLRDLGVQLCVDDFGTGYSSLRYLHRFPIQTLKIDRAFVHMLNKDTESAVITQSIVALAHTLGMDVVAEGIETAQQQAYLQGLHCEYGQGFWFARPVNGSAATALLKSSTRCKPSGILQRESDIAMANQRAAPGA